MGSLVRKGMLKKLDRIAKLFRCRAHAVQGLAATVELVRAPGKIAMCRLDRGRRRMPQRLVAGCRMFLRPGIEVGDPGSQRVFSQGIEHVVTRLITLLLEVLPQCRSRNAAGVFGGKCGQRL